MAPLYAVMPPARPALNTAQKPLPVPRPGRAVRLGALENQIIRLSKITKDNVQMLADAAPGIDEIRGRELVPL
jgi:hypothetical protein